MTMIQMPRLQNIENYIISFYCRFAPKESLDIKDPAIWVQIEKLTSMVQLVGQGNE